MAIQYPYSDDLMIFNEKTNRYQLTPKAIDETGINLRQRLESQSQDVDVNIIMRRICERVSEMVYSFIHMHNIRNEIQDEVIKRCPSARNIIFSALNAQLEYFLLRGDLMRSTDEKLRRLWFDETAKEILTTKIDEIGQHLLYRGAITYDRYLKHL